VPVPLLKTKTMLMLPLLRTKTMPVLLQVR